MEREKRATLFCTKCGCQASQFDEKGDFCDATIGEGPTDRCNGRFEIDTDAPTLSEALENVEHFDVLIEGMK